MTYKLNMKDIRQMRLAGCYGLMIPDYAAVEIGEYVTIDNEDYMIVDKQSLSKYTDGVYAGRPAWIQLRGFKPEEGKNE